MNNLKIILNCLLCQFFIVFIFSSRLLAGHITLAWDPVPEPFTGYKLYYGSSENNMSNIVTVGKVTTYTLTGLQDGQQYYIQATAYNSAGESPPSNITSGIPEVDDIDIPSITITNPTSSSTYSTSQDNISLGGIASDNDGVALVSWSNNRGGSGTASGTENWLISSINLYCGEDNIITVTVEDFAGNTSANSLTVDIKPCQPVGITIQ